ncbi:MAG: DUF6497 family protein [Marinibacterium sp.]|nr:DUF6497 family protein [Marinibacterium sp.]
MTSVFAALALGTSAADAASIDVPSGQSVDLHEVLLDDTPGALWVRFRFVAPQISATTGAVSADVAAADMDYLCTAVALPYIASYDLAPQRIVVSLSDRALAFGMSDPDATQYFELYSADASDPSGCVWEGA